MSLVVESTSTTSGADQNNLTLTKPSGVEAGDLLLLITHGDGLSAATCTGFTSSLSKAQNNSGSVPDLTTSILYKIADSGDEAASNYTIALTGSNTLGVATMLRISGWESGDPIHASASAGGAADPVTTTGASSLALARPAPALIVAVGHFVSSDSPLSSATFSGYSITSGVSNPSWTEVNDTEVRTNGNLYNKALAVAYANTTDTSDITAYSISVSSDSSGADDGVASLLAVIVEPTDASGTNALLEVAQDTIFSNTGVEVGGTGTNTLLEASPTFQTQSGNATSPTQWTNEAKPTDTSWTNESK